MPGETNPVKSRGYTLFEVLVCLFILSVFVAVAGVSFIGLIPKLQLQRAVWEVNAHLNYARYRAIFYHTRVRAVFLDSICVVESYREIEKDWVMDQIDLIDGVMVQANNRPVFHPNGNVSSLASILISNKTGAYKITIAISGRIKILRL